jgi:signal transduction histidine kinase
MRVFDTRVPEKGEVHVDGKVLEMAAHPVTDENNRFVGVVQISSDITERKSLEKEILELSSKERSRIGHDLHDGLGQYLTGIAFLSTALHQQLTGKNPEARAMVEQIVTSADKAQKLMRSILQGLCLVADEPRGLMSALAALTHNTTDLYKVPCSFVCEDEVLIDDHILSTHLFFIAHEALTNAIKHSLCSRIHVSLDMRDGTLCLSIRDDGRGIFPPQTDGRGMGLRIMRYRASRVRATLEVKSAPGQGTAVTCLAPLLRPGKD